MQCDIVVKWSTPVTHHQKHKSSMLNGDLDASGNIPRHMLRLVDKLILLQRNWLSVYFLQTVNLTCCVAETEAFINASWTYMLNQRF